MWPFTRAYPERRVADLDGQTYDYIVIGGGTAGAVVAARLSEDPSASVLLLERGPINDIFLSRIPLLSQNYTTSWCNSIQNRYSEPVPAYNGRRQQLVSGEGLGGTTRINCMLMTRGAPGGYNEWAAGLGLAGWAWKDVEPYFAKIETALHHGNKDYRGHTGPYINQQTPLTYDFYSYMAKSCEALGLPVEDDCNAPSSSAQGFFRLDAAVYPDGTRVSTYRAYLDKEMALTRLGHLTICTEAVATKLEFNHGVGVDVANEPTGSVQTTGVYVASAPRGRAIGTPVLVKARREIIVCGGALRSPQLLMLSGLGPRAHLERLGIPCVHDLPAVGQHLADHLAIPIMMEMPAHDTLHHLMQSPLRVGLPGFVKHILSGTGLLSMPSNGATIFVRTTSVDPDTCRSSSDNDASQPQNVPDVEIMMNPVNCIDLEAAGNVQSTATRGHAYLTLYTTMVQLRTAGRLELVVASDAQAHTRVFYPELGHDSASQQDWVAVRRAVRFAMRLAEEFVARSGYPHKPAQLVFAPGMDMDTLRDATKGRPGERTGETASPAAPATATRSAAGLPPVAKTWKTVTDAEIDAYVRETCQSSLHYGCTNRMAATAQEGVVDPRLRVHGVAGLRVADASVFPKIPNGHTMAPTLMVGERCADFILEDWAGTEPAA